MTQLVGRFVELACPNSSLEGTKTYGICASSLSTGRCEMMSIGLISPARIRRLQDDLRVDRKEAETRQRTLFRPSEFLLQLLLLLVSLVVIWMLLTFNIKQHEIFL
jgi:hypothetical protein